MRRASSLQGRRGIWSFFLTALLVVVADQLSKLWIRSYPEGETIFQVGFFRIIHVQNTGAAFGLFRGQAFALAIISFVGVAVLLLYALLFYRRSPLLDSILSRIAIGLILGGVIGNLIDRIRYLLHQLGGISDFISIGIWPAFNIADSAVVVGVIIFAYSLLFLAKKH
jgi:signal peptidase II